MAKRAGIVVLHLDGLILLEAGTGTLAADELRQVEVLGPREGAGSRLFEVRPFISESLRPPP